jgi:hypothetical protein
LYAKSTSTFKSQDGKTQFTVDANTIVFYVPYGTDKNDVDNYKKYTKSKFLDDYYFVEPYDIDGVTADVVVWYGDDGDDTASITAASPTVIVNAIDRSIGTDGKEVYAPKYTTLGSTTESEATVETKSILSGVEVGDIIKLGLSGKEVDKVALVYDASEEELYDFVTGKVVNDGYAVTKYNGNELYYQAHLGLVYGLPESGYGTLAIEEDGDIANVYTINRSTKYYKLETGRTTELSSDYTHESLDSYVDYGDEATKVVVVAIDTIVKGVYIVD